MKKYLLSSLIVLSSITIISAQWTTGTNPTLPIAQTAGVGNPPTLHSQLHLYSSSANTLAFQRNGVWFNHLIRTGISGSGGSSGLRWTYSDDSGISWSDLIFFSNDNGRVGINTINPTELLDVDGGARFRSLPTTSTATNMLVVDNTGRVFTQSIGAGGSSDADWYQDGTTSSPTSISDDIFTYGKVQIGDNSSSSTAGLFDVYANNQRTAVYSINSGAGLTLTSQPIQAGMFVAENGNKVVGVSGTARDGVIESTMSIGVLGNASVSTNPDLNYEAHGGNFQSTGAKSYGVFAVGGTYSYYGIGDYYVTGGGYITSDRALKRDFNAFNAMNIISNLKPVSYKFKEIDGMKLSQGLQYGFIADEYKEIMPNFVKSTSFTQESGEQIDFEAISTDVLIPILIKGLQEQQEQISALQKELNSKSNLLNEPKLDLVKMQLIEFIAFPNPAQKKVTISLKLRENLDGASILITDLNGKLHQVQNVINSTEAIITFDLEGLSNGIYLYSLVNNGEILISKQLVLNK